MSRHALEMRSLFRLGRCAQRRSFDAVARSLSTTATTVHPLGHKKEPKKRLKTRLTEDLGIEHPIVQGIITALTQPTPSALRLEIEKCKAMTSKPFGVNVTFLPAIKPPPYADYVSAIIDSGVKIVETAGNNPKEHGVRLKEAKVTIIHKCTSIRHALSAQKLGVDYVSIDGFECAGHPGEDDVTGLILLALAAKKLKIPYIASGGFGDGRGLAAALALGAQGVNMGTRFMCTFEAPIHENIKQKIVEASEKDTALLMRSLRNTARFYKNAVAEEVLEVENRPGGGATFADIKELVSGQRGKQVFVTGDSDKGVWTAGQVIGLIDDIPTCAQLVERMVEEAVAIIERDMAGRIVSV
ncbi:hypothetical protein HDU96_010524 [Phlyctochytrium bullatum]|nr:hypothetical protein HDU96_010524 [Phlyctochytrium bullatum]